MAIARLQDVLDTVADAVEAALETANAPGTGQVFIGWPVGPEAVQIFGQPTPEGVISVWPLPGASNETRYPQDFEQISPPVDNLLSSLSTDGTNLTFTSQGISGVADSVYNIYVFLRGQPVPAYYQTTLNEPLSAVASGVAAAVNGLNIPGVSATATGATTFITGSWFRQVNIGGSGLLFSEQSRIARIIRVSVWINDWSTRFSVADAIMQNLGTASTLWLQLSDKQPMFIRYHTDMLDDSSSSAYSVYVHHIDFEVEYPETTVVPGYQIAEVQATTQINSTPPVTTYIA